MQNKIYVIDRSEFTITEFFEKTIKNCVVEDNCIVILDDVEYNIIRQQPEGITTDLEFYILRQYEETLKSPNEQAILDYKLANKYNLTNIRRWENGINHHPKSERIVRFIAKHDFNDYNDTFCFKIGGDGDNGETLMYQLDAFFEMLDKSNQK